MFAAVDEVKLTVLGNDCAYPAKTRYFPFGERLNWPSEVAEPLIINGLSDVEIGSEKVDRPELENSLMMIWLPVLVKVLTPSLTCNTAIFPAVNCAKVNVDVNTKKKNKHTYFVLVEKFAIIFSNELES